MPRAAVYTRSLTRAGIRDLLLDSLCLFAERGTREIEVRFGWGCDESVLGATRRVRLGEVVPLVDESILAGDYDLGEADLHLVDGDLEILLCHESDVHAESEDLALADAIQQRWLRLEFQGYRTDAKGEGKAAWRFWGPPGAQPETPAEREDRLRQDPDRPRFEVIETRALSAEEQSALLKGFSAQLSDWRVASLRIGIIGERISRRPESPVQPLSAALRYLEWVRSEGLQQGFDLLWLQDLSKQSWELELSGSDGRARFETSAGDLSEIAAVRRSWADRGWVTELP